MRKPGLETVIVLIGIAALLPSPTLASRQSPEEWSERAATGSREHRSLASSKDCAYRTTHRGAGRTPCSGRVHHEMLD